jgi:Ni,Fe-hydrogenase III large subunit
MELETFSRTLAKLRERGITVEGMRVTIHDLKCIEEYVCGVCSIAEDCSTHRSMKKKMFGKAGSIHSWGQ